MQLHIPFSKFSGKMTGDLHFHARNVRRFYKTIRERDKLILHLILFVILFKSKIIGFLFKKISLFLFYYCQMHYFLINNKIYIGIEILRLILLSLHVIHRGKSDVACRHIPARTYVFQRILITYYNCIRSICTPCTPSAPEVLSSQFPRRIAKWF